jgi:hypothetical protein
MVIAKKGCSGKLINVMEQCPSSGANSLWDSQEIYRLLRNPKVHYSIRNSPKESISRLKSVLEMWDTTVYRRICTFPPATTGTNIQYFACTLISSKIINVGFYMQQY